MIPRGFFYKYMFLFLIYFFKGKLLLFVFIFYIVTAFYYYANDGTVLVSFIATLFFLLGIRFYLEDSFKKEFYRYKKYLVLKRKRTNWRKYAKN